MTFHGYVHDQEMLSARQVRAADDTRTSSAGPPTASDLNRKATERGVAAIRQDARESLDYSVRTYYTKTGITYLQRTTTLPDGVRVRGSHCITIGEPGEIRITFHPAAVDLCHKEFEQLRDAIRFEAERPPNAAVTERAPDQWYCRRGGWREKRAALADAVMVAAPNCRWWGSAWGTSRKMAPHQLVEQARGSRGRTSPRSVQRPSAPIGSRALSRSPINYGASPKIHSASNAARAIA